METPLNQQITARIKELRLQHNLSMGKFAEAIHVSAGNVGDWENPNKNSTPTVKALVAIAETFNVSLNWLLLGKEDEQLLPPIDSNTLQFLERFQQLSPDEKRFVQFAFDWLAHNKQVK